MGDGSNARVELGTDGAHPNHTWPVLGIDRARRGGLIDQIVSGVTALIHERRLAVGAKMPSVRQFAKCNGISTFTVVEAYDRLVTTGVLSSRRGSGYFITGGGQVQPAPSAALPMPPLVMDALTPELYSGDHTVLPVGSGWLPPEWYGDALILDAVRQAMRMPSSRLRGYGHPLGFPSLRHRIAHTMSEQSLSVQPDQIVLTHGATHAFDLILRTLAKPGDHVFVEDPGYSNLIGLIQHHGCIPVGIRRDANGLDLAQLEQQAAQQQPRLMFVNTVLHNPLGTSLSHTQAHHLLGLAEKLDFWLVEDDVDHELAPPGEASLAAMDGLRRVIRVGSFSKTLSPALRVGSICASRSLIPQIVRVKMLAGLTTSEINERAVYHAISTSAYRRMLDRLRSQLEAARERSLAALAEVGMTPIAKPRGGIFISAGWPCADNAACNGKQIANQALKSGILLSPNDFFTLKASDSIWFRFNVAYTDSPLLIDFLRGVHSRLPVIKHH